MEKRFNVKAPDNIDYKPSYNISVGHKAPVISSDKPKELQLFEFGLTPSWAEKKMYLINARSEGKSNKENDPRYTGTKGIISMPSFRKPIRSQRCLVPADAFIEGTTNEKLNKPYVVYLTEKQRPFAFAGIWDTWLNKATGEITNSFAIITTVANELLQKLPHHRSPVILNPEDERTWLSNDSSLDEITSLLQPYNAKKMNAYPVSNKIKSPDSEGPELLEPTGQRLVPEHDYKVNENIKLFGMGEQKKERDSSGIFPS